MYKYKGCINGDYIKVDNYLKILNPKDFSLLGTVPSYNKKQINEIFISAKKSFYNWKKTPLNKRVKVLEELCALLIDNKKELSNLIHLEIDKNLKDAEIEIERSVEYIQQTINCWNQINFLKKNIKNKIANINRVPLGVVLAISPFNYPVNLSISKIAPALLIGNSVVFKPATNGSLVGCFLSKLILQTSIPKGVFHIVTGKGSEIGDILIENNNINMISFTGSINVGKKIAYKKNMIPLVLEMGGNDAAYVRYDSDINNAVKEIAKGAFSFSGQRCTAIKRLILHKNIEKQFLDKFIEEVKKININSLVSSNSAKYVEELIQDSKKRNDIFLLEGKRKNNYLPLHIVKTDLYSRVWKEEAFGPILPFITIENEKELINIFNNTNFGLQNSIFTKDIDWAKKIALDIESGSLNINSSSSRGPDLFPFLGVKDSGFGVQGIQESLISMSRILNIVEIKK